jgi:heme o synthase
MVLVTATIGYVVGGYGIHDWSALIALQIGVVLVAAGASVLNHYLERDFDALMERTRNRPIPAGVVPPHHAFYFGIYTCISGVIVLLWQVNLLTAFLGLLTAFLYVLVYTPLKRLSWWNTPVGAIPGALPIMGGWTAATGQVDPGAWALFAILFVWQHPHFYAIAWIFREDYARGGFKMLPVVKPDGRATFSQSLGLCAMLIPVSLMPWYLHLTGPVYAVGAVILGLYFLAAGFRVARSRTTPDARHMMKASIIYLPLLMILLVIG